MMSFALKYRAVVDSITADKGLKLRRYELDDEDWKMISDLVSVLEVCTVLFHSIEANIFNSNTKKLQFSSQAMQLAFPR
jgi:hypothetical protein